MAAQSHDFDPRDAACRGLDPFSDDPRELRRILELCRSCPIRRACRASWDAAPSVYGVWGGRLGVDLARARLPLVKSAAIAAESPPLCLWCGARLRNAAAIARGYCSPQHRDADHRDRQRPRQQDGTALRGTA